MASRHSNAAGSASLSERVVDVALELDYTDIPKSVVEATKLHVLDTIGCGLAAHALAVGDAGRAIAATTSVGGATVIGRAAAAPPVDAALANGMLCHALDFDDTHGESICHIGVVVVPSLLAVAEAHGRSGRDLLTALIAGSELIARVGAASASEYMVRGFHPTSVCGVFGSTIGAARLLGLGHAEAAAALGIAGSMASGLFAYLDDGAHTKPIHAGWAASAGLRAAQLAAVGGEGPRTIFEDRFGFFAAYFGGRHDCFAERVADLGELWETEEISFKAYPACHFVHGCLDAAAILRDASGWRVDEICAVTVAVPDAAVPLVLEPLETKQRPRTEYDAKFSVPYSVAVMLTHGRVDLMSYAPDALADHDVAALAGRVRYERRSFATYPTAFPGWVRIELADGERLEYEAQHQRGAPENPMTALEVVAKFRRNAALALDRDEVAAVESAILSLEEADDMRECFTPLAGVHLREVRA